MKLTIQASTKLKDGLHEGTITAVEYRTTKQNHEYTDLVIESEKTLIKYSIPTFISPDSRLGKLLTLFGVNLEIGQEIEPEVLIGKKCQFQSFINDNGYSTVIKDTVKPLKVI